jgi:uncharacterized protein
MPGSEGSSRSSFRSIAALTILPVAGLLVFFGWLLVRKAAPPVSASLASVVSPRPDVHPHPALSHSAGEGAKQRVRAGPSIVIIIDDIGYDDARINRAMSIDPNLNFAVLPNSTRGAEVAERLNNRGFEILCHLPMEPRNANISPGENAVLTSMSDREITDATRANIAAVPHARGVNNHMGSLATADRRVMTDVMRALPRGMYFIDSRTGGRSVAADVAREQNVKTATRQVFLDDVQTEASVHRQLAELSATARTKGVAIGIGHPHDVTLRVLAREVPQLRAKGFRFVRASEVVN